MNDLTRCLTFSECRTMERHRHAARGEDFDYPPMIMESGGFSPTPHPPPWLGPPPPYEVAIKTTCSSTHLRRAYSDTHLASEPLFGQSREISFEVWWLGILLRLCCSFLFIVTNFFTHLKHGSFLVLACFLQVSCNLNYAMMLRLNVLRVYIKGAEGMPHTGLQSPILKPQH